MNWANDSTDRLCDALLSLKTREECYEFLEDICTIKEIHDMSQRLSVAQLLSKKVNYSEINAITGASSATICRVSKCYEYGSGGYKKIIERMGKSDNEQ